MRHRPQCGASWASGAAQAAQFVRIILRWRGRSESRRAACHSETLEGLSADFGFAASQGRTDAPKATGPVAAWPRVPKQAPIQSWSRVMRLPRRKVAAKLRCSQRTGWSDFEGASCSRARFPELGHDVAGRGECSLVRGRPLTVRKRPAGAYEAHTRRGYNRRLEGPHGSAIV